MKIDCPFRLTFEKTNGDKKYELNKKRSIFNHKNHSLIDKSTYLLTEDMKNFIFEKMIIKKYCPSDIVELVNAKFASNIDRKTISNYLSRINSDLFGSSDSEFNNLISLLNEMEKMGF